MIATFNVHTGTFNTTICNNSSPQVAWLQGYGAYGMIKRDSESQMATWRATLYASGSRKNMNRFAQQLKIFIAITERYVILCNERLAVFVDQEIVFCIVHVPRQYITSCSQAMNVANRCL